MIRVLHVDDDRISYELTKIGLTRVAPELEITWCKSGVEALELLEQEEYHCVISDYQMPEMDGLELLNNLRGSSNNIPFILLTGMESDSKAELALEAGSDDYFTKERNVAHFHRLAHSIMKNVKVFDEKRQRELERSWLDQSNSLIRAILQSSPIGIFATDIEGNVETSNQRCLEILRIPPDRLLGSMRDLYEYFVEQTDLSDKYDKFLESLMSPSTATIVEFKNGTIVELHFERILRKDACIGYLICISDITHQVRGEREIQSLIDLLDFSEHPLVRVDMNGFITYANKASKPLLKKWKMNRVGDQLPGDLRTVIGKVCKSGKSLELIESFGNKKFLVRINPSNCPAVIDIFGQDLSGTRELEDKINTLYELWDKTRRMLTGENAASKFREND